MTIASCLAVACMISQGCGGRSEADPAPKAGPVAGAAPGSAGSDPKANASRETAHGESCLGVTDQGIWDDLDPKVQIVLPVVERSRISAQRDEKHGVLVVSIDGFPRKVYPLGGPASLKIRDTTLKLRDGDAAELKPLLSEVSDGVAAKDRDGDGIPDPLDVLIGAKKTAINGDAYTEGYVSIPYPMGDVPRTMGVCTDVIIRAVRNAGLDLQQALHDDIAKAPRAYPMIKGRGNAHIDQRRVGSLLPYFQRHWEAHTARFDDPDDPLRPGDVIFMDTFPGRTGPDHIGILSDTLDDLGMPLVINNWTDGMTTREMDLLTFVPVLYRFRLPPT